MKSKCKVKLLVASLLDSAFTRLRAVFLLFYSRKPYTWKVKKKPRR